MTDYIESLKIEEIAGLIALVISIISISYTYKGVKLSKYVETITNQRIKWIDILRSDFSRILTLATLLKSFNDHTETTTHFEESNEYFELEPEARNGVDEEITDIKKNRKMIIKESINRKTINTIELAILRLNEEDDKDLIKKLDILKNCFLNKEYKQITNDFVRNLRMSIKLLLKNEWEKVKDEAKKGGKTKKIYFSN